MKSLSVKQAQKWLERIKEADPSAFRQIGKCLRKFDQTSDQLECFMKMNQALFPLPCLAQQINVYMEDGNKFIVNKSLQQRLNIFLDIVRNTKFQLFKEIVDYVNKVAIENKASGQSTDEQTTQIIKTGILNIVKSVPSLIAQVEKIIPAAQDEALKKLDLKHLKNKVIPSQKDQQDFLKTAHVKKVKKLPIYDMEQEKPKQNYRFKNLVTPIFLNVGEQKSFLKQIQKKVGSFYYDEIMKILELYHKNIISRIQLVKMIEPILEDQILGLKDIVSSRQMDRRKTSSFKPLSDIDFHILPRQTHSYVQIPRNYPHYAANRTKQHMQILNNNWVSVPRGSEVIFNVRIKNLYELALNKCQDERYQFDLVIKRFKKISQIFEIVLQELQRNQDANVHYLLKDAVSLGVIQLLYKNATKQQKQTIEDALYKNTYCAVKVYYQRVLKVIQELQECRKIYAIKIWSDVAHKNFHKSLDFKNHDFKNNQKFRMKPQSFIQQINNNVKFLQSRGTKRINDNPFDQKTQFFSILNSFQTSSKKQRCLQRKLPKPQTYDLNQCRFPALLPAIIMAFQDRQTLSLVYTYLNYYIEYALNNQGQKSRCRAILKQIMNRIFKMKQIRMGGLSQNYQQEKFYVKLFNKQIFQMNTTNWVAYQQQNFNESENNNEDQQILNFNSMVDQTSQYSFEPPKSNKNIVFYASQNFYVFLRFFYSLYERVIRMKQVAKSESKLHVFEILYYANIKTKQSIKFQDSLNIIFSQYGYLFSTFYKIIQGVCKSLSVISLSPLQNHSLSLLSNQNQQVYLLLLNRYMLNLQTSPNRLVRVIYEYQTHLVYINSFNPYYRFTQENLKQHNKKRLEISKNVQNYNQQPIQSSKHILSKKPKTATSSRQQYYFENMTSRLVNIACYEDLILGVNRSSTQVSKQIQKLKRMRGKYKL